MKYRSAVVVWALFSLVKPSFSESIPSRGWIDSLLVDVNKQGISEATWLTLKPFLKFDTRVNSFDQAQPEFTHDLTSYLEKRITNSKIHYARQMLEKHDTLLNSIESEFNVPKELIVSLWGLESDFGRFQGNFNLITSLTSLAAGRRGEYFRRELIEAIVLFDEGNYTTDEFTGSWAGAIGQCQFMPWNARNYGVDYDQNGIIDLKHSTSDALASIANFIRALGWNKSFIWGRPVSFFGKIEANLLDGKTKQSLKEWEKIGIRRINGDLLPDVQLEARLLRPEKSGGRVYLVYPNFDVIMKWNRSHYFALTVGTLLNRIKYR
ncbi:MAG: lytic murein transglycosylase [Candidatus Latescibacterota bacterium]|nr:lytic murein transglycosylase [Candidatus Latescibacterota bacterium]